MILAGILPDFVKLTSFDLMTDACNLSRLAQMHVALGYLKLYPIYLIALEIAPLANEVNVVRVYLASKNTQQRTTGKYRVHLPLL